MPITFRKLRKKLNNDNIDKEKLTEIINQANTYSFKKPLPKTIVSQIYRDKEISMSNLEILCNALKYNIKDVFEVVSEEEKSVIQKELKTAKKTVVRKQPIVRKTYIYGESLEGIAVGDYIVFGEYPYTENGEKKPLQWIVREIEEDKLFLISRYVIDVMQYHTNSKRMNWDNSEIRKWLNSDFINIAFSAEFADHIIPTRIKYNSYNRPHCLEDRFSFCTDKVFLLGYEELLKYYPTPYYANVKKINGGMPYSKRKAAFTPYAKTKEYTDPLAIVCVDHHIYNYLLRDTIKNHIGCVISKPAAGSVNPWGVYSHENTIPDGIRPAMWVKK